jgi:hypothetical protein
LILLGWKFRRGVGCGDGTALAIALRRTAVRRMRGRQRGRDKRWAEDTDASAFHHARGDLDQTKAQGVELCVAEWRARRGGGAHRQQEPWLWDRGMTCDRRRVGSQTGFRPWYPGIVLRTPSTFRRKFKRPWLVRARYDHKCFSGWRQEIIAPTVAARYPGVLDFHRGRCLYNGRGVALTETTPDPAYFAPLPLGS